MPHRHPCPTSDGLAPLRPQRPSCERANGPAHLRGSHSGACEHPEAYAEGRTGQASAYPSDAGRSATPIALARTLHGFRYIDKRVGIGYPARSAPHEGTGGRPRIF